MNDTKRVWLTALTYWLIASSLTCLFSPMLNGDGIARYVPMAEAFARGEWKLAYHPRYGVLFNTLAGTVVWCTPLNGMSACHAVGFLLLAFAGVATWMLAKSVFGNAKVAWICFLLVLLSPEYVWPANGGYRDTGRILGLALVALGMTERREAVLGAGIFTLSTLRADTWLVASVITGGWLVWKMCERAWMAMAIPLVSWLLGSACVVTLTWLHFGYWLPSTQYIRMYLKCFGA